MVKIQPATQETLVPFLGQEDPLEEGLATHSSIPAWRIPQSEASGKLQSLGSQRVRQDREINTFIFTSPFLWIGNGISLLFSQVVVKNRPNCILTQGEHLTRAETEQTEPRPSRQARKPRNLLSAATESTQIFQISSGTLLWAQEADDLSPRTRALTAPLPGLSSEDRPSLGISPCLRHIWLL